MESDLNLTRNLTENLTRNQTRNLTGSLTGNLTVNSTGKLNEDLNGNLVGKLKITRPGVDKVKPKVCFKCSLWVTNRNIAGRFHHTLIHMGDLHLVLPALNLSTLDAGILIMVQQERMKVFSLDMVDYSVSFL